MIRSPVFLAQPDAGFSPLSFRRLIGTASPGPGAHPRTRVFDSKAGNTTRLRRGVAFLRAFGYKPACQATNQSGLTPISPCANLLEGNRFSGYSCIKPCEGLC